MTSSTKSSVERGARMGARRREDARGMGADDGGSLIAVANRTIPPRFAAPPATNSIERTMLSTWQFRRRRKRRIACFATSRRLCGRREIFVCQKHNRWGLCGQRSASLIKNNSGARPKDSGVVDPSQAIDPAAQLRKPPHRKFQKHVPVTKLGVVQGARSYRAIFFGPADTYLDMYRHRNILMDDLMIL
jgi:hypothetical protein